jgi:Peptidase family C25/Concanavalin A-like lectin/glucanases superfamily/Fibronectin type III domain/PQQ-like domain
MGKTLVRILASSLILLTSSLTSFPVPAIPAIAAVQTLHSYYFSGNTPPFAEAYISVNRTLALNSFNAITLEAWVKRVDATRNETVVCNDPQFSYCLGFQGSQVFFSTNGSSSQVLSTGTIGANYWVHIAGTYANGVSQIYINGVLDTSAANSWGMGPSVSGSFGIGADLTQTDPQSLFKGWIDNVRLWNVARSGSDIRATMFEELGGTDINLVSEWRLNGDATDSAGVNPGTPSSGVTAVIDGALPHDLRIPLVSSAPALDGACGADTEYNQAVALADSSVGPSQTSVYLERTSTDLWVCFDQLTPPTWMGDNWAAVYLDPNYSRDALSQPTDFSLEMHHDGSRRTRIGDSVGDYTTTTAYDSQWAGIYFTDTHGGLFTTYSAEFRISNALIDATSSTKTIGLALAQHWIGSTGDDRNWPALAGYNSPQSWSAAILNGTGPARTFSGHIYYQPQGSNTTTGIPGVAVQLIGSDPNTNTEAITAAAKTLSDGSFSLTSNDDYPNHRLAIDPNTFPKGYMPSGASALPPGTYFSDTVIDFHAAGGGSYGSIVYTITDVRPNIIDASNAPYFLIIAPQAVIDSGALKDFIDYKQRIGFKVEAVSIENAVANYAGANTMQHIRSLEVNRYLLYGPQFGYVMLVGSDNTLPFGRIEAGAVAPNDCKKPGAGWPTDWFYADLTSNWDTNGNGCWGDGIFGDSSQQADNHYTPDSRDVFHLTVAVGRLPFDNPDVVRTVLADSVAFERSALNVKRQALLSMSMMGLNGECWDLKQNKYNNCNYGTDGAYLGQAMLNDILVPNGLKVYRMYENQPTQVGGVSTGASGVMTAKQDTYQNLSSQLGGAAYGLVSVQGHGWGEGVVRTYWKGDANGNGLIDQPTAPFGIYDQGVNEVDQPEMFDVGSLPSRPGQTPIFLVAACSTGEFDDPNSLGASLLSNHQGTAWVGGTGVVPYSGGWQNPGDGGMQSINYNVAYRMLNYNQRLGDAVWDEMNGFMTNARQHPEQGWWAQDYDLYGDPTLSYWGDPGGQATLSPWPMLRADPYGHGATTLMGPSNPIAVWSYPSLARVLDTLPPSPAVTKDGDAVIAQGNFVDVVREGSQRFRLTLSQPDYGSPAIAADGTIYALDRGGKLYAFGCGTNSTCTYSLHWTLDLGSRPLTSPVIGPDGLVAIGHEGSDSAHSLIALVRSDGFLFDDQIIEGNPVGELAVGGDRVVYATTDLGQLVYIDYTCHLGYCTRYDTSSGAAYTTPPLIYQGDIYAGKADGTVVRKNPVTLAQLNAFSANGAVVSGPIVAPGGSIVVGTEAGTLYALSPSLAERWHANLSGSLVSFPAASASDVYIANGNYLYAYEPYSGTLDWLAYLGAGANGGTAAVGYGRQVYVQTRNGPLVDIADNWTPPNPWLLASPTLHVDPAGGTTKSMTLSWATLATPAPPGLMPNATPIGFLLQRRVNAGPWQDLVFLPVGTTSYVDTSVQEGVLYDYRIQTLDAQGNDSDFTPLSAPLDSLPATPGAPTLGPVTPQSSTSLQLTWTPGTGGTADSYRVERSAAATGPFTPLATVTGGTTSFSDTGLTPNSTEFYRVVAINTGGESSPSALQSGTTFSQTLPAPQNVSANRLDPYHVQISWDPGPSGVQAVIEVNVLGQSTFQRVGTSSNAGPFTDLEINPNSYAYRIKFVQGSNESPYSLDTLRLTLAEFSYEFLPVIHR